MKKRCDCGNCEYGGLCLHSDKWDQLVPPPPKVEHKHCECPGCGMDTFCWGPGWEEYAKKSAEQARRERMRPRDCGTCHSCLIEYPCESPIYVEVFD